MEKIEVRIENLRLGLMRFGVGGINAVLLGYVIIYYIFEQKTFFYLKLFMLVLSLALYYSLKTMYDKTDISLYNMGKLACFFYMLMISVSIAYCESPYLVCWFFNTPVLLAAFYDLKWNMIFSICNFFAIFVFIEIFKLAKIQVVASGLEQNSYRMIVDSFTVLTSISIFSILLFYSYKIIYNKHFIKIIQNKKVQFLEKNTKAQSNYKENNAEYSYVLFDKIESYMIEKQPWLDPSYGLAKLARDMGTNTLYVSRCINLIAQKNFKDYVNKFRLDFYLKEQKKAIYIDEETLSAPLYLLCGFQNVDTLQKVYKKFYKNK